MTDALFLCFDVWRAKLIKGSAIQSNDIIGGMKYRLMFRCNSETDTVELVLTQKLVNFNARLPAVISIKAVLKQDTSLSKAILSDELEIEFKDKQIAKIDGLLLEEIFEFERYFTVELKFLSDTPVNYDVLESKIIE